MARITEAEAKRQLEEGGLSSLYVVAGEEKHMVRKAAQKLITQAAGEAFPEFNRNELDSGCDIDALCDACVALPFMAEHPVFCHKRQSHAGVAQGGYIAAAGQPAPGKLGKGFPRRLGG